MRNTNGERRSRTKAAQSAQAADSSEGEQSRAFDLEDRLLDYAVRVIRVVEALPNTRIGNHVAGQLLKSGTSPLSNHAEAQSAESPADFVHKMRIGLKELRESHQWLRLGKRVPLIKPASKLDGLINETNELISIFVKSIKTARTNQRKHRTRAIIPVDS